MDQRLSVGDENDVRPPARQRTLPRNANSVEPAQQDNPYGCATSRGSVLKLRPPANPLAASFGGGTVSRKPAEEQGRFSRVCDDRRAVRFIPRRFAIRPEAFEGLRLKRRNEAQENGQSKARRSGTGNCWVSV